MALEEVQLKTTLCGKELHAPFLITGMTGGSERAGRFNSDLGGVAEAKKVALGLGSQRAMLERPSLAATYQVRPFAPSTVLLGNLGLWQARALEPSGIWRLMEDIGADGMAIHVNAAQELTQPEGDRDFRGGYATVEKLAAVLGDRLVLKETGCGISPHVAKRLVSCGVRVLDLSGLGGTSWVQVERLRLSPGQLDVGQAFVEFGLPTAAAVALVRKAVGSGVKIIASGGISDGLEAAKALALGADLVGMARPLLVAHQRGGVSEMERTLDSYIEGLRRAFLLTGSRNVDDLRRCPTVVLGELKDWLASL